jgi:hypothetical protein
MGGTARGKRQINRPVGSRDGKHRISLADALNATGQHTVPVLPALDSATRQQPTSLPPWGSSTERTETPSSRRPRKAEHIPPFPPESILPGPVSETALVPREVYPPSADPEMTRVLAQAQLVLPDVMADSISAAEVTRVIPPLDLEETRLQTLGGSGLQSLQEMREAEPEAATIFIPGASKPHRHHYARVVPRRQGSQPVLLQFMVAMLAAMLLFSIFTAASPLGSTVASLGIVQAYANSIPWVPTPTPKPKPVVVANPPAGANPGTQAVINEIVSVFGGYAQGALNVARCESGYNPNARNPYAIGTSHAEGVFQILYPSTWDTTSYAADSPYNASDNIHAAHQIFARDGNSWREWACQP